MDMDEINFIFPILYFNIPNVNLKYTSFIFFLTFVCDILMLRN